MVRGEVWGDANAALGMINRNGLGKTRHLDIGLLWIQQVAAEQRLKFGKVLGVNIPADLFTKYLDEKTARHHTNNLGYREMEGRPSDAPQLHNISTSMDAYQRGNNTIEWPWLAYLMKNKHSKEKQNVARDYDKSLNALSTNGRTSNVWQQVLWGCKQRVQGSNGSNAAQPSCPQGSTLTFQSKTGVSWRTGLRHGATMRPRGRHLREDMILLPHGVTHPTAREQRATTHPAIYLAIWLYCLFVS